MYNLGDRPIFLLPTIGKDFKKLRLGVLSQFIVTRSTSSPILIKVSVKRLTEYEGPLASAEIDGVICTIFFIYNI